MRMESLDFGHWQRVHVRTHRDNRGRAGRLQHRDHDVFREAGPDLETDLAQIVGYQRRCLSSRFDSSGFW